jgi:hypothetical protein
VEPANFGSDRHAKRDPHRISCAHTTCDTPHRAEGALVGASQPLMECTRRLAALSRAVECLAMDVVQKSSGCSVLLGMHSLALGLTNSVALHLRFAPAVVISAPVATALARAAPADAALARTALASPVYPRPRLHQPTFSCSRRRCLRLPRHLMQQHIAFTHHACPRISPP